MSRFYPIVLVAFLFSFLTLPLYAKDSGDPAKKAELQMELKKKTELRKAIEVRKTDINGTEWKTTLIPNEKKEKPESDTLTFQNSQVTSKFFSGKGFSPTNYTVTLPEGTDKGIWETMQTSSDSKEGVVFIRGEWLKDAMSGQVTQQLAEGKTKEYYFTTSGRVAISPISEQKATSSATSDKVSSSPVESDPSAALVSMEKDSKSTPKK